MRFISTGIVLATSLFSLAASALPNDFHPPRSTGAAEIVVKARGLTAEAKLSPDLRDLVDLVKGARGPSRQRYTAAELEQEFGIKRGQRDAVVTVALTVGDAFDKSVISRYGGSVLYQIGNAIYASVPVIGLVSIASDTGVQSIAPIKNKSLPPSPAGSRAKVTKTLVGRGENLPTSFDHHGLSGKGVIVGVIDSGIDWKHDDFRKPDGTSRVLMIWDMTDDSWKDSNGATGSEPPFTLHGKPVGTLYTGQQINDAIAGKITIPTTDLVGHGTACAGTAAGNGRASGNGVDPGTYQGVAPDADLIIVRAGKGESISSLSFVGTKWIADQAKSLGKPCVISQSYGSTTTSHDGSDVEDAATNEAVPADAVGLALCVAAGNEGQYTMHAGGRFGAAREGQADIDSDEIELFVKKPTMLSAFFNHGDQWGLCIAGLDKFLVTADGKPALLYIERKDDGSPKFFVKRDPTDMDQVQKTVDGVHYEVSADKKSDNVQVSLPPGRYVAWGYGATENVTDGAYDLYLPFYTEASFGRGSDKTKMVDTPGDSDSSITVGAYNCRNSWENLDGKVTNYNIRIGDIAPYSSPGFRRDGAVKPDIAAPATYMISSLSSGSEMGKDGDGNDDKVHLTKDGKHLAWQGTSAATPFAAGVIALLLEKNPKLTSGQIKSIITKTAVHDSFTGGVPNTQWGYGKLDPEAAILAADNP